jgi:NADH:ubiquinone oxidoreductase subunit 6 (subunit J)
MQKVDYLKLSDRYASFLVAVGGVSITVLALVLTLGSDTKVPTEVNSRSFLVAALVVATVTCFVGAHMMAETAAFISNSKQMVERERVNNFWGLDSPPSATEEIVSDNRLFLLASTNIFIATILVLFALMLLPASSGRVHAESLAPISVGVFLVIVVVALYWMILAGYYRMAAPGNGYAIWLPILVGILCGSLLCFFPKSPEHLLWVTFMPSALSTVVSMVWFASIFKKGDTLSLHKAHIQDVWFFSLAITLSYAPLVVVGLKTICGKPPWWTFRYPSDFATWVIKILTLRLI